MPLPVFFFLIGVYYTYANFIPQADISSYEDDLISPRFREVGGLNPSVADDSGDVSDNGLNLWRSNAVSVIPGSPDQIIVDEKLPNGHPPSSEQSFPLGLDHPTESSPTTATVDPATCNPQYRPDVPGFSNKAKRENDFCRIGKPKCKQHWISLCCYGSPLADEGGLTAGCVVCMRLPFLIFFNFQAIAISSFEFPIGDGKIGKNQRKWSIQRYWMNHPVDE